MFVYKHTSTIEYVKKLPSFWEKYKLHEAEHIKRFSNLHVYI